MYAYERWNRNSRNSWKNYYHFNGRARTYRGKNRSHYYCRRETQWLRWYQCPAWTGEFIVVEADEFDRTFLKLTPTIAALTTLEKEHLDTYRDLDDIKTAFIEFANKVPFYGFVVICLDEPALQDIIPFINKKILTYGLTTQADIK